MNIFTLRSHTLAQALVPEGSLLRDAGLVVGFSVFIALLAQVSIPLEPVPITGQTLGILLTSLALGGRLGTLAVLAYLLEGLLGLPVFAGAKSGWGVFAGPTGGYLLGFLLAAPVVGFLADRGWTRSLFLTCVAMVAGTVCIYVPGLLWLGVALSGKLAGLGALFGAGLFPFIPGDLIKIALATVLLPSAWAFVRRR